MEEGRRAENSRERRKIMMQNKRRSGGSDKCLRGINVKSSSKRTLGGGGKRESERGERDANKPSEGAWKTNLNQTCSRHFVAEAE